MRLAQSAKKRGFPFCFLADDATGKGGTFSDLDGILIKTLTNNSSDDFGSEATVISFYAATITITTSALRTLFTGRWNIEHPPLRGIRPGAKRGEHVCPSVFSLTERLDIPWVSDELRFAKSGLGWSCRLGKAGVKQSDESMEILQIQIPNSYI